MRNRHFQHSAVSRSALTLILFFVLIFSAGCTPKKRIMESASKPEQADAPAAEKPAKATFETDIAAMRTAEFRFVYVFRRKDGGPFTDDDKRLLGSGMPMEINRRKLSDEGRALIVGSNFRMPEDDMNMLKDNFAFQDMSLPRPAEPQPANDNAQ